MKILNVRLIWVGFAVMAAGLLIPHPAMAQAANGLGNVLTNIAYRTRFTAILSTLSYVMGCAMAFWGLMRLKAWVDGQGNIGDGLMRILGGAFMIGIPSVADSIINSLFGSGSWAGQSTNYNRVSNLSSNYGNNGGWLGLDQAMENFVLDIYEPGKLVTSWAAYIVGICCFINGIYRLAQSGQASSGRAPSGKGTAGYILGGALLFSFGELMDTVTTTLFGNNNPGQFSSLAYAPAGVNATSVNNVVTALFAFVEVIGWVAFVRGIYLLVKLAQGGADRTHAHAFTHIVFGAAAVNMYAVVKVVQSSLGVSLVN